MIADWASVLMLLLGMVYIVDFIFWRGGSDE